MSDKLESALLDRDKDLDKLVTAWRNRWQDVIDYVAPSRADITQIKNRVSGSEKTNKIFDSTPTEALNTLAAGFMGYHTSQTTPWFSLIPSDRALLEFWEVKAYLEQVTRQISLVLQRTNYYPQMHEFYLDLGGMGTAIMYAGEDPEHTLYFKSCGVAESKVSENSRGLVDTLFRTYVQTVRQLVQDWSVSALSKTVQKCFEDGKLGEEFEVLHAVFPSADYDDSRLASWLPHSSVYMLKREAHIISARGYYEFPFMVTRWSKNTGETYGYSPAIDQMPNIKTLNIQERSIIKAGNKAVDPPLDIPPGYRGRIKTGPAGLNYRQKGQESIKALYDIAGNVPVGIELRNQKRDEIKSAFYTDVFMMLANLDRGQMTIPELMERVQEKLIILGPVLGRLHFEATGPMIERSFGLLSRADPPVLPPPPEILRDKEIEIEYISTLARAQRAAEGRSTAEALNMVTPLAEIKPEIMDKINADEYVDYVWDIHGAPTKILNNEAAVKAIRAQRQQAIQEAKAKEDALLMMEGAKTAQGMEQGDGGTIQ